MVILGIDPGLATTGYGLIDKQGNRYSTLKFGVIKTHKDLVLGERLKHLESQLLDLIQTYQPECAAIESLFFNRNVTSAITVGAARGVAVLTTHKAGLTIVDYSPPQVKLAVCGVGSADKKQVQYMVKQLLNLDRAPKPDDAADALALAICHGHSHRVNSLKDLAR